LTRSLEFTTLPVREISDMNKRSAMLGVVLLVGACGGKTAETPPSQFIAGFSPAAVQPGYTRYVLPQIHGIQPGEDDTWCQYISPAATETQDVISVTGQQTKAGHHIALYATNAPKAVGTSRKCLTGDQLSLAFIGGVGGEGIGAVFQKLPPNVTFRLPKGWGLMANTHFVNTTAEVIDGQGVVDVKYAPPSPDRQVLNLFTNVNTQFTIPASAQYSADATCTVQADMQVVLFFNHMHERGTSIMSEIEHADGTKMLIRQDSPWQREFTFNPDMTQFALSGDGSLTIHKGDIVHTHCEWQNTDSTAVTFPLEMCVGGAIVLGDHEVDCVDTQWDANAGSR
jgi:hypothetical protein